jgi:hypothetical protein
MSSVAALATLRSAPGFHQLTPRAHPSTAAEAPYRYRRRFPVRIDVDPWIASVFQGSTAGIEGKRPRTGAAPQTARLWKSGSATVIASL